MKRYDCERRTTARPETVWKIWSDPATWGLWNPSVRAAALDGPMRQGAMGSMTTGRESNPIRVVAVEQGRSFELELHPVPATTFFFECRVTPDGQRTKISQSVGMEGVFAPILSRFAGKQIANSFGPILDALAKEAEAAELVA